MTGERTLTVTRLGDRDRGVNAVEIAERLHDGRVESVVIFGDEPDALGVTFRLAYALPDDSGRFDVRELAALREVANAARRVSHDLTFEYDEEDAPDSVKALRAAISRARNLNEEAGQ